MKRRLPTKPDRKQKLIILAVNDFFSNSELTKEEKTDLSCWLMNRKKGIEPTDELLETAVLIRTNLADEKYRTTLLQNAPVAHSSPSWPNKL